MRKTKSGFTIVELLIVIVVIGILAAITIVAYNGLQQRTRDTARITGLRQIEKAVELYRGVNGSYPLPANGSNNWAGHCPDYGNYDTYIIGVTEFLPRQPIDPRYDTSSQCYLYRSDGVDYIAITHFTMESICGADPSDSCNASNIRAMDRSCCIQPTIAVYSPGAAGW